MDFVVTGHRLRFFVLRICVPVMAPAVLNKNTAALLELPD